MLFRLTRTRSQRRGVTLVEMMVAVALLVLMMTVIVTIFTAATGAVSGLRTYQELDANLRQLDSIIRQDLQGVTARLTPPLDPKDNLGYFEYGENQFADRQGEDTDDYIRFTAKAPEGQSFTGRVWVGSAPIAALNQPIIATSQYAEIIYFLRNGNLYRRVLLVAPDLQPSIKTFATTANNSSGTATTYQPDMLGKLPVSWQGVNDLSAHPSPLGTDAATSNPIILNTLGDLTNRENRFAYPRFANDFVVNSKGAVSGNAFAPGDGIIDDENQDSGSNIKGDGVPDYYPTLYPEVFNAGLIFEFGTVARAASAAPYEALAFPFLFPGAYSKPDVYMGSGSGAGWIHSVDPNNAFNATPTTNDTAYAQALNLNHAPLDLGDNLPAPQLPQSWWGFPTWRETMSPFWQDPGVAITAGIAGDTSPLQPDFLHTSNVIASTVPPAFTANNALPPMTAAYRTADQPFNDGVGSATLAPAGSSLWGFTWEDDLVMTNVRSFDIKAYDNAFPGYVDLGWGDDLRLYQPYASPVAGPLPYIAGVAGYPATITWPPTGVLVYDLYGQTFAHEGRIPPRVDDQRLDAQFPNASYPNPQYSAYPTYTSNIGDDNASVIRLRRIWDSWSTKYTRAPANGFNPTTLLPVGPPFTPPVYPSYPPPYPAPLRGLQIQIRVVDPQNQKIKTLTIRQDFSDKL